MRRTSQRKAELALPGGPVKWIVPALLLVSVVIPSFAAEKNDDNPKPAQSIEELHQQLEKFSKIPTLPVSRWRSSARTDQNGSQAWALPT